MYVYFVQLLYFCWRSVLRMGQQNKKLRVGSFPWVSFPLFVSLTFESLNEIQRYEHSNETSSALLSHGTIYLVCSSNFWVCGWNPMVCHHSFSKSYIFLKIYKNAFDFLVTFFFDHSRSNSFNLGNQSNNEWYFEQIGWNGSRMRNNCFLMTHFLSPFREPSELKQDLNSCPKAQGW